jgi:MFS family permease
MGVVFQGLLFCGAVVTALGASFIHANTQAAWGTMFVGRTLFGFGGESLSVVQSAMIASYFQGKELAFALGVNLALARMGSVLNNEISAVIASHAPVALAFWVGAAIVGGGFISMLAVFYLDLKAENRLRASIGKRPLRNAGLFASLCKLLTCCCRKKPSASQSKIASAAGTINNRSVIEDGTLDEKALSSAVYGLDSAPPSPAMPVKTSVAAAAAHAAGSATGDGHILHHTNEDDSLLEHGADAEPTEEIHLGAVLHFPMIYWALVMSCVTVYIDGESKGRVKACHQSLTLPFISFTLCFRCSARVQQQRLHFYPAKVPCHSSPLADLRQPEAELLRHGQHYPVYRVRVRCSYHPFHRQLY